MICVDDLAGYMREQFRDNDRYHAYAQRPLWTIRKADERIWVAKIRAELCL